MLIFTGIYVDIQVSTSSNDRYSNGAFVTDENKYPAMWAKFTYFSFAMMTLCGAGLDIKPRRWYSCFAVCNQMILGLFFHVYVFGIGLLLLANKKYGDSNKSKKMKHDNASQLSNMDKDSILTSVVMPGSDVIMSTLLHNN